jgi:hypothetical protein
MYKQERDRERERANSVFMLYCRFTRKLLAAVVDRWDSHVLVIDKVAPPNWKVETAEVLNDWFSIFC